MSTPRMKYVLPISSCIPIETNVFGIGSVGEHFDRTRFQGPSSHRSLASRLHSKAPIFRDLPYRSFRNQFSVRPLTLQFSALILIFLINRHRIQVVDCAKTGRSIRFFLNDGALPIGLKGCPKNKDGFCPLDAFIRGLQERLDSIDWQYDCLADYKFGDNITDGRAPR
jgi:hypothetical protein